MERRRHLYAIRKSETGTLEVHVKTLAGGFSAHKLAGMDSFLKLDHPNVMIETVKRAEDSEDVIIRQYETEGTRIQTNLYTAFSMSEAWLADLMEECV